jgi:uncharacterized protein (TIGR00369 family)
MAYDDLDPEELERLRAYFRATPLHALLQLEFVEEGEDPTDDRSDGAEVVVRMPVRPEACGGSGNLHGGAIATLVDVASAAAAARAIGFVPGEQTLVTADLHVRYLGRPHGDTVFGRARVVRAGRQLIVVECKVVDVEGRVIASADFASMLVPLRRPLVEGAPDAAGSGTTASLSLDL